MNHSSSERDTYWKFEVSFNNVLNDDSVTEIRDEIVADAPYESTLDSTFALKSSLGHYFTATQRSFFEPNPVGAGKTLHYELSAVAQDEVVTLEIFDQLGRVLWRNVLSAPKDFLRTDFAAPQTEGTYYLLVRYGNSEELHPFIVIR